MFNRTFFAFTLILGLVSGQAMSSPKEELQALYTYYKKNVSSSPSVKELVNLDQEIRKVIGKYIDEKYETVETKELGIETEPMSGALGYDGRFLAKAHEINPNSIYRKYTLFSEVEKENGVGSVANINSALKYVHEFPNGPYAYTGYRIIGGLYHDVYYTIFNRLHGIDSGEKDGCFDSFIQEGNYEGQLKRAKSQAILFFQMATKLDPKDTTLPIELDRLKKNRESNAWFSCSD